MQVQESDGTRRSWTDSRSWLWGALAGALMLFANGRDSVWMAAWLAPVFLLRFVRTQRAAIGLPVAYALAMATFMFQFRGMVPIPGVGYYVFLASMELFTVLPFALDRWLARRLGSAAATLVLPTSWVAVELAIAQGPYGTWGAIGYSQYGNLPVLQILSVTGLAGLAFLIGWFAAVSNRVWEEGWSSRGARRNSVACAGLIAAVVLAGGARLTFFPPAAPTVRVASLTRSGVANPPPDASLEHMLRRKSSSEDATVFREWAKAIDDDLLLRTEREAVAGAKIVFWGEANGAVLRSDEPPLVARARELAAKNKIYLGMAIGSISLDAPRPLENKLILIGPDGTVAWQFLKARPVPGGEAAISKTDDGKLKSLATPYGKLSSVICFDGDFPDLLAQAGAIGTDIVLVPSNDWRAIDPWHTQMASFRAIEQGFNLVRHTSQGLSAAFDYEGRQLAAMDHYATEDRVLVAQVPTMGVSTIYARWREWFAVLCVASVAVLVAMGASRRRQPHP